MRRHDRVILKQKANVCSVSCCTSDHAYKYVQQWIANGFAFVFPQQQDDVLRLGMVFVDQGLRHRVTVQVRSDDVLQVKPPLLLSECLEHFCAVDAVILKKLNQQLAAIGCKVHVFGSVSWELISGQKYWTEASDLDLLIDVPLIEQAEKIVNMIRQAASQLSFRIDGELRFPTNECINWLEFAMALENTDGVEVLVKSETGVYLIAPSELLEESNA